MLSIINFLFLESFCTSFGYNNLPSLFPGTFLHFIYDLISLTFDKLFFDTNLLGFSIIILNVYWLLSWALGNWTAVRRIPVGVFYLLFVPVSYLTYVENFLAGLVERLLEAFLVVYELFCSVDAEV